MVAVVWLVWEKPAPIFTCGGMVCERSRQPGHAGHGVEYQIREESFCFGTYRWAKILPFLRKGIQPFPVYEGALALALHHLDALRFALIMKSSHRIPVATSMSPPFLAAASAFSFPITPTWDGHQAKRIVWSLECSNQCLARIDVRMEQFWLEWVEVSKAA